LKTSERERRETQNSSALVYDKEKIKEEEWNGKGKIGDKEGNILGDMNQKRVIIFLWGFQHSEKRQIGKLLLLD
jgi:hypothetical protein